MNPFTEGPHFVLPSMNRVRLVDLPGLAVPLAWQNKQGYQLLGRRALVRQIRRDTAVLQLNPHAPDLLHQFDACFESPDDGVRETAVSIAHEYGRKLAFHQLVLKRADAVNRVVRSDWQAAHWNYWAQIRQVWLGGGLMAGHCGAVAAAEAQTFIRRHGFPGYTLAVSPHAASLPLLGAARAAPPAAPAMLVFDFGQTAVKRAVAHYRDGVLVKLTVLRSLPAGCPHLDWSQDRSLASQTRDRILHVVGETWMEVEAHGVRLCDTLTLVLACYLLHGQPRPEDWGCYGRLQQFAPHLASYLAAQLEPRIGQPVQINLLHDGQAAALPYAGQPHSAVITFGTALGIGFPPALSADLRPVSKNFELEAGE